MKLLLTTLATLHVFRVATSCTLTLKTGGDINVRCKCDDQTGKVIGMVDRQETLDASKCYDWKTLVDEVASIVMCSGFNGGGICIVAYCFALKQRLHGLLRSRVEETDDESKKSLSKECDEFDQHCNALKGMIIPFKQYDIVKVRTDNGKRPKLYVVLSNTHSKQGLWPWEDYERTCRIKELTTSPPAEGVSRTRMVTIKRNVWNLIKVKLTLAELETLKAKRISQYKRYLDSLDVLGPRVETLTSYKETVDFHFKKVIERAELEAEGHENR